MAERKGSAVGDQRRQVRAFLVERGLEVAAVRAVQKAARGGISAHRVRRSLAQCVAVEDDADPLCADRGVDEIEHRVSRCEYVRDLAKAGGERSAASGQHELLHEAAT